LSERSLFRAIIMQEATTADSLGARIISAARLAAAVHAQMDAQDASKNQSRAMIGGTDRLVTDDNQSVVSGPLSVVQDQNN
jgi:hypothetical protein